MCTGYIYTLRIIVSSINLHAQDINTRNLAGELGGITAAMLSRYRIVSPAHQTLVVSAELIGAPHIT
jgi:hypothetical protein